MSTKDRPYRYPLERGWNKRKLIREAAQMELTQTELAAKYGVTQSAISHFIQRHADEIEAVKREIENEFAGLWIAKKEARLAELQQDVEDINELGELVTKDHRYHNLMKRKQDALKAVAEELGQLPPRVNVSVDNKTVNYKVEGIELDDLK